MFFLFLCVCLCVSGLSTTLSLWRSLLTLLQDEDQEVRDSASDFISHVAPHLLHSGTNQQPGIAFCISCAFSIPATIQEGGLTMSPCRFAQAKMYIWNRTEYSLACYLLSVSCVGDTSDQASQGIANCMINSNPLINWPISPPGSIKYFWFWNETDWNTGLVCKHQAPSITNMVRRLLTYREHMAREQHVDFTADKHMLTFFGALMT
jgi:hypothetical protein